MKATIAIESEGFLFRANMDSGLDLSIPIRSEGVSAFGIPRAQSAPFVHKGMAVSVDRGSAVNCYGVHVYPHAHGTHTECVGHISPDFATIDTLLPIPVMLARLLTVNPVVAGSDKVIAFDCLEGLSEKTPALIVRTQPNGADKNTADHSGRNPTYVDATAMEYLVERGVEHLLIDLPSVDPEDDGGAISAHKRFWRYPEEPRSRCTITELIYVPDDIPDGTYILDLQIAPFVLDAAPSRPIIYPIIEE